MLDDLKNFIYFILKQKNYKRVFFFENSFIEQHIYQAIPNSHKIDRTLIISLYPDAKKNIKNIQTIYFKKEFFLSLAFIFLRIPYCYSSTPDLNNSSFVKSSISKTKYIYIQHSPMSLTMIYRDGAFNSFDAVQVVNKFQLNDLHEINIKKKLKIKPIKSKYLFINKMKNISVVKSSKKKILLAPTHGTDFYEKKIHLQLGECLDFNQYDLFFRPHLMSIKKKDFELNELNRNFNIDKKELNFSEYDYLITDWSGIYIEFAFFKNKKSILINSSKKILNDNFQNISNEPMEIETRKILGFQVELNELKSIILYLKKIDDYNDSDIKDFFKKNFY
jgi:hypothetical protein